MTSTAMSFLMRTYCLSERWLWLSLHSNLAIWTVSFSVIVCLLALAWSKSSSHSPGGWREPPTYSSTIPILGNLVSMGWNSSGLFSSVIIRFKNIPARVRLVFMDIYVISGSESIQAVWKEPDLHNKAYKALSLHNMMKMPKDTLAFWMEDDSGHNAKPYPDSNIPPHLRIDHLTRSSISKFLTGDGLKPFARRFATNLTDRLLNIDSVRAEWSEFPDLFTFMQAELLTAAVDAMCGRLLLSENHTFVEDFWAFSKVLPGLAKGYPRWLFPKHYRARDKCLASIKRWHGMIWAHFEDPAVGDEDWNPHYGAEVIKFRHIMWSRMPRMNADAAATEDLGLVWAANGNSVHNSFWMVAEVIRDPELLSRVRCAVDSYRVDSRDGKLGFEYVKLCDDPLLQSVYAETLRLHVASYLMRGPALADLNLRGWRIPKDAIMLISSYNAQNDPSAWCTSDKWPYQPVEGFWSERFLEHPRSKTMAAVPSSITDQSTLEEHQHPNSTPSTRDAGHGALEFPLKGRSGNWIPYGGGQRMCPGRHFAKQEMISSLAVMLTLFDIELIDEADRIPQNDMGGFGFGALWPKTATPIRMRLRGG